MKTLLPTASLCMFCWTWIPCDSVGAIFTLYDDRPSFEEALVGTPLLTQDFETLTPGTDLRGVEFLPGVFVTSPFERLEVWPGNNLFGYDDSTRVEGKAYYDIRFAGNYSAVGFNVAAWNPAAPGPAIVEVFFSDGSTTTLQRFQTSGSEGAPVFTGIISDHSVTRVIWHETPEIGGTGNEEVALDDFIVGRVLSLDSDGDGVSDEVDHCPNTSPGTPVDTNGCSIDQLVPCAGPRTGGAWKNHGHYVSTVAKTAEAFLAAGLITEPEKDAIVKQAARSTCGKR